MRLTASFLIAGVVAASSAAARPADPRVVEREVEREVVRDVTRGAAREAAREVSREVTVHATREARMTAGRAYQGRERGPEQTDRFSRKVKIGRDGRVSVSNISGDITV